MSGISDTATVTLNVNGQQAKKEMEELQQKIDATSKRVEQLREKVKDKAAFTAAKDSVAKYTGELDSLKTRLKDAVDTYQTLKDEGAAPDVLRKAREAVKSLKEEVKQANENLKHAKTELADFDPKILEKAKRDLKGYKTRLDQLRTSTVAVRETLENLDKVAPKELEKTLRALNKEFKNTRQGTEEYEQLAANIRMVKEQLSAVREDLRESQSLWERFKDWSENAWPALDLISRGYDLVVDKMREYVDAYAEMDQEMASVRKFTGMAAKEVERLNQEFRKMDTRTSREELNMLAQEAGRLGKQSVEDVMGFVRAADQINVALDDLGKGATLTLSKLTGTFGIEEIYGTEKALLKVGSVINDLSQNCSASAPYLANFTERMAGVGVQAGMSIQQIMGFGAVLDEKSQAVEASATALSQVLVRLYQDPAKYARVAGLDVQNFSDLLRKDANSALLLFLETLNKAGGMDVLSPMFKDMGETGSRAISALSTLAENIDKVKAQQEAANEAFEDGTSVTAEFTVQNNTVQAGLEKVKNAAHEFQVELGEKLYPLVQHFLSSTSVVMKALLVTIGYIYEHKASLVSLVVAIGAYNVAINMAIIKQRVWNALQVAGKVATVAWTAAMQLAAGALALCSGNITRARAAWVLFSKSLMASPIGLAAAAIAFLVSKIVMATMKTDEFRKSMDSAMKTADSFAEETHKEIEELDSLFGKLQGAEKGTKAYNEAKNSIISKYGVYLQGLLNEKGEIMDLATAYDRLTWAAKESARARGLNAAKESLDSTFFQEVGDMAEKIRSALKSEGMGERQLTKLITSITQSIGSGQDISKADREEIAKFERKHRSAFADIFGGKSALAMVHELRGKRNEYQRRSDSLDSMDTRYFSAMGDDELTRQIKELSGALANSPQDKFTIDLSLKDESTARNVKDKLADGLSISDSKGGDGAKSLTGTLSRNEAENLVRHLMLEQERRGVVPGSASGFKAENLYQPESSSGKSGKAPERFAEEKAWRERSEAEARIAYAQGIDTYSEYTLKMNEILEEYNQRLLDRTDLTEDERLKINADYWEALNKLTVSGNQVLVDQENKDYEASLDKLKEDYRLRLNVVNLSAEERKAADVIYQEATELAELKHLEKLMSLYKDGSEEKLKAQRKYLDAELAAAKRHQQEMEDLQAEADRKLKEERERRESLPGEARKGDVAEKVDEARAKYQQEKEVLDKALADGLISQEEYELRMRRVNQDLASGMLASIAGVKSEWASLTLAMIDSWRDFANVLKDPEGNPFDGLQKAIGATSALMTSVMSQLSAFTQAELTVQTAKIQARYDKEIEMAEGNSYKIAKLEKEKEAATAKLKNEANRKMFNMQVIQAVAQTAQNAVEGFGAGLQAGFPMALWLAPALAALATAQGAVQIALIKKQQQASEAQGYSKGGFTKPGAVDEPAGVVHAGEWVASQRLLASPVARPMIEALDYAQRTNTIGSLRSEDVSRSITANQTISMIADTDPSAALVAAAVASNSKAVAELVTRLKEPFVTVNTVTGDTGIKQAQDEYTTLMKNKSPKSRRNADYR